MQIKHVAWIGFTPRWPLQHERNLPIGDRMLRQIVENDERIHSIIHEPLAHGRPGEWCQVLVGSGVRRWCRDDRRIWHGAFLFENRERARYVGIFLTDRDVDAIERPIIVVALILSSLVQARLADDGIDGDRTFASRAVADNQLALSAANRNHRINRHDASLHRLIHAAASDDARRNFFKRIKRVSLDWTFSIQWLAQGVNNTPEQCFADWNLQWFPCLSCLVAFRDLCGFAQQNSAHCSFFEVQCETEYC